MLSKFAISDCVKHLVLYRTLETILFFAESKSFTPGMAKFFKSLSTMEKIIDGTFNFVFFNKECLRADIEIVSMSAPLNPEDTAPNAFNSLASPLSLKRKWFHNSSLNSWLGKSKLILNGNLLHIAGSNNSA